MTLRRLEKDFYFKPALVLAGDLLGKYLHHHDMTGMIVETEAYKGVRDLASHASWKRKQTCFPMWKEGGFTYVYLTYGVHHMLNISAGAEGDPQAVLVRAIEPITGIVGKTNGPGLLTKALGINKDQNNVDLTDSPSLFLTENPDTSASYYVVRATRVGVDYAGKFKDKKWRFFIKGNKFVSRIVK